MQMPKPGEYVAVAVIIGITAAVLYPILKHIGPHPGNGAVCHGHLRQIGLAISEYVQAYRPVETASYQLYSFSSPTNFWYADAQKPLSGNGVQTLKAVHDDNRN